MGAPVQRPTSRRSPSGRASGRIEGRASRHLAPAAVLRAVRRWSAWVAAHVGADLQRNRSRGQICPIAGGLRYTRAPSAG